ncbi:MAG: DUF4262 domain-containing protein [Actinomycetota bacterium]|nr:DUF4262 domain-containing protein [Actinomycetota bacterium]
MDQPGWPDKSKLDDADRKLLADVEQYGWHCLHVGDDGQLPCWSFSIGVYQAWQHPDVVIFGLANPVSHELLTHVVDRVRMGERFSPGRDYGDIFEEIPCCFLRVDPGWYPVFLGYAQWFYETPDGFPVLQLVWPDKEGQYAWDPGNRIPDGSQPLLISDDEAAALGIGPTRE